MNDKEKWQKIIHQMAEEGLNATNVVGFDEKGNDIVQSKYLTAMTPAAFDYTFEYGFDRLSDEGKLFLKYKYFSNQRDYERFSKEKTIKFTKYGSTNNINVERTASISYDKFWKANGCMFLENKEAKKLLILSIGDVTYVNPYHYESELSGTFYNNVSAYMVDTSRDKQEVRDAIYRIILDQDEQKALVATRLFNKEYSLNEGDWTIDRNCFTYKLDKNEEEAILNEMDRYPGDWIIANSNVHVSFFLDEYNKLENLKTKYEKIISDYRELCRDKSLEEISNILLTYDKGNLYFNGKKFDSEEELNIARDTVNGEFTLLGDMIHLAEVRKEQHQKMELNEQLSHVRNVIVSELGKDNGFVYSNKEQLQAYLGMTDEEIKAEIKQLPVDESASDRQKLWNESVEKAEAEIEKELNDYSKEEGRKLTDLEFNTLKNTSYAALVWTKAVKYAIASDNAQYIKDLKENKKDDYLKMVNVLSRPFKEISPRNNHFRLAMCNVSLDAFGNKYVPIYSTGNYIDNSILQYEAKSNAEKEKIHKKAKKENNTPIFKLTSKDTPLQTVVCYPQTEDIHYYDENGNYLGFQYLGTAQIHQIKNGKNAVAQKTIDEKEFKKLYPNAKTEFYAAYRVSRNTLSISQYPTGMHYIIDKNLSSLYDYEPNKVNDWNDSKTIQYAQNITLLAKQLDKTVDVVHDDLSLKEACNTISDYFVNSMITDCSEETKKMCSEYFSNVLLAKGNMLNDNTLSIEGTIDYAQKHIDPEIAGLEMYSTQRFVDSIVDECYSDTHQCLSLDKLMKLETVDVLSKSLNHKQYELGGNISNILNETLNVASRETLADDIFSYKYENNDNLLNKLYAFENETKNGKKSISYFSIIDYNVKTNKAVVINNGNGMLSYTIPDFDKLVSDTTIKTDGIFSKDTQNKSNISLLSQVKERVLE